MIKRFLFSTVLGLALIGGGCAKTPSTDVGQAPPASSPIIGEEQAIPSGAIPTAEAPSLLPASQQPTPLSPEPKVVAPAPTPVSAPKVSAPIVTQPPAEPAPVSTPTPTPTPQPTTHAASIQGFTFSPATLTVKVGDTVVWTQMDDVRHNVVLDNGSLTGPLLAKGETFSHTFTVKGTFPYHCQPHPSMKATIVVE